MQPINVLTLAIDIPNRIQVTKKLFHFIISKHNRLTDLVIYDKMNLYLANLMYLPLSEIVNAKIQI